MHSDNPLMSAGRWMTALVVQEEVEVEVEAEAEVEVKAEVEVEVEVEVDAAIGWRVTLRALAAWTSSVETNEGDLFPSTMVQAYYLLKESYKHSFRFSRSAFEAGSMIPGTKVIISARRFQP